MVAGRLLVVAKKIVAGRYEKMADFHCTKMALFKPAVKAESSSSSSSNLFFDCENEDDEDFI
jgi:hypothetical protein